MSYKQPLTVQQQIVYLENNKEVIYTNMTKAEAEDYLTKNNYINVISPFKYCFADKDSNGNVLKDQNGRHIYSRKVEFKEYVDEYEKERKQYPVLFEKISIFERTFNAVISYEMLVKYNIINFASFSVFVDDLLESAMKSSYDTRQKVHMVDEINKFEAKIKHYNSPYIFFDRLSLNEVITIYRLMEPADKKRVFNKLQNMNSTLGYPVMSQFDEALSRLVQIRNCVYHGNSLTVLTRYYKVKTKQLRTSTDKKKFFTLIKHILAS